MRLQRRPSAAPRCSCSRSWEGRPRLRDRRTHPGEFMAALLRRRRGRRAGGPEPAGGPGEGQQHDDNGHAPPTTRVWLSGSSSAPPIAPPAPASSSSMAASLSIVRLRRVHVGRAARRRAEMAAHSSLHRIRARSPARNQPGIGAQHGHGPALGGRLRPCALGFRLPRQQRIRQHADGPVRRQCG